MPIIAGPDGKRISFPDGTPDADIASAFSSTPTTPGPNPSVNLTSPNPSTAPKSAAPPTDQGFISRAWDYVNSPIHALGIADSIKADETRENAGPTLQDAKDYAAHPFLHTAKDVALGLPTHILTGAAKMLLTPLGVATVPLGAAGKTVGSMGTAARMVEGAVGAGFAGKGAYDAAQNPSRQDGESWLDYAARMGGNAAMMLGGTAAVGHSAGVNVDLKTGQVIRTPKPSPAAASTVNAGTPPVDPAVAAGQQRLAQAVGAPTPPVAQTIHVDPGFANDLHQWNQNDTLPGKRVILKKNAKTGQQTVHLAHTDPDVQGFQYTNPTSSNVFSDTGAEGQVPVELSRSNGVRGTSTPGHFLANQIVGDVPSAAPEVPAPAAEAPAVAPTPAPEASTPPATTAPQASGISEAMKDPALQARIRELQKQNPSWNASRLFQEAYTSMPSETVAPEAPTIPTSVDKVVVPADPTKGIAEVKLPVLEGEATPGGVRPGMTGLAEAGEPIPPAKAPIKAPVEPDVIPPETPPVQAQTPPVDVSPLEDKIRPLVGQAVRFSQLRAGEAASHAIDTAIDQTRSLTGGLDEDLQGQMSQLLKEPVGKNLTPEQIEKLEALRGAQGSSGFSLRHGGGLAAQEMAKDPDAWQHRLDESFVNMAQAINDPSTPPDVVANLTKRMLETDRDGNSKPWLYEKGTVKYPEATPLDAAHPEAPFATHGLGNDITPITFKNYEAILGKEPRDLFFGREQKKGFVTPEENEQYTNLRDSSLKEMSGNFGLEDLIGKVNEEGVSSGGGSSFTARASTSQEFRAFDRDLRQRVLARKLNSVIQELKGHVGDWNQQRGGLTPLTDQLSKLPEDVRKYLPKELFDYEKSPAAQADNPSTPTRVDEQPKASGKTKAPSTAIKSGQETPIAGIKTTKFDGVIAKKFPAAMEHVDLIQKGIEFKYPEEARQSVYNRAMEAYHDGLVQDDPFALKRATDVVKRIQEAGFVNIGKGDPIYTPEELHAINSTSADAMLKRWEKMSESELLKKKNGLWKDSLVKRVEGAMPTSDDPVVRMQQADTFNELQSRLDALKEAAGPTTNLRDSVVEWANNFVENRIDKQRAREVRGRQYRNDAILRSTFDSVDRLMNNLPIPEQDRFYDNMSRGTAQSDDVFSAMDPKFRQKWEKANGPVPDPNELALRIRNAADAARERLTQASGKLEEYFVNYMPGMWENVAAGKAFAQSWASRRPLEGSTEFLRQKEHEFYSDGLKAQLQPVTSNPVRAMMMRIEQMNRFTMAHEFKNKLVDGGFADWYNVGETPPEGHEILNDRIFGQGGQGNYFAPSKVARTFNNFVSTGLTGGWRLPFTNFSLYDAIKHTNNLANMMQLGFSAFHGVETTLNSGFTTMAVGLKQVLNEGKLATGTGNILKGATFIGPLIEDAWNGQKALINFRDPTKELGYAQTSSDLEMANANVRTNPNIHFQEIERLKQNWARATENLLPKRTRALAVANAAKNLLAAGVEATSYPLMTSLIPRVKVGAFYKMALQIHEEMAGQHPDAINAELQKAWDSVDNRFGQVNYDNMFMNKTVKDIMALSVRSPGWNIGTLREVGGGVFDLGKSLADMNKPILDENGAKMVDGRTGKTAKQGFKISNRTAYTGAMVAGTMFANAMYHYIHTGRPAQGADFFFPKDGTKSSSGEDNRVYPKTYVYDFINLYHDPVHTVWHKAAPDISTMADLIQNEDYYHHQIRDPGNSPVQNAASTLGYMAHQFVPFSVGNISEANLRGQKSSWEGAAGILPAPRWVGRTTAENLAFDYFHSDKAPGAQDAQTLEKKKDFILLRNKVASGEVTTDQVQEAVDKGKLQPKMVKYLYDTVHEPQIVTWTKQLTSEAQTWNVWKAASPEERKLILPTVIQKEVSMNGGEEQQQKLQELEEFANKQ